MKYKIFGYTNFKYIELALYWSSYVQKLGLDYTIYCTDEQSFEFLKGKNINCEKFCEFPIENFDFTQFGLVRFHILEQLLKNYDYVIYSDLDAVWLENPLEDLLNQQYDAHLSTVHHASAYPGSIRKKWGMTICTGWMAFKSSSKVLIEDFISQYFSFKHGNDQQKFNEFLYSINNEIDTNIDEHSFVLDLEKYQLKALGVSKELIHRGKKINGSKVVHPLITGTSPEQKIKALDRQLKR